MSMITKIWHLLPIEFRRKYGNLLQRSIDNYKFFRQFKKQKEFSNNLRKVVIIGYFSKPIGIGRSAHLLFDLLTNAKINVTKVDAQNICFTRTDIDYFKDYDAIIAVINPDNIPNVFNKISNVFFDKKKLIGFWVWETSIPPKSWKNIAKIFNEIWTPSKFSKESISKVFDGKIKTIPHPAALMQFPQPSQLSISEIGKKIGIKKDDFVVLNSFSFSSSFARKNLIDAIDAFNQSIGTDENSYFLIRYMDEEKYPKSFEDLKNKAQTNPRIILHRADTKSDEIFVLYKLCNIYLSLHRCEGFGLNLAEAMLNNLPVIATNWSGNTEFMDSEHSYLVDASIIDINDPDNIYTIENGVWAQPNIKQAAQFLTKARNNPKLSIEIAQKANDKIKNLLNQNCLKL